jgi:hypothetical protein
MGAPPGTRTPDPLIKSQLLACQIGALAVSLCRFVRDFAGSGVRLCRRVTVCFAASEHTPSTLRPAVWGKCSIMDCDDMRRRPCVGAGAGHRMARQSVRLDPPGLVRGIRSSVSGASAGRCGCAWPRLCPLGSALARGSD